jgi:DNA-binding Lrp family transcriptional regulator
MAAHDQLDAIDLALIAALQDDARQTNRDLAAAVHVSPSTSSERVRALQARGVVRGFHADIDPAALNRNLQALIAVRIRPPSRDRIEAFRDWLATLPGVVGTFVVSGGEELADVRTSIVYEHVRRHVLEPLPSS